MITMEDRHDHLLSIRRLTVASLLFHARVIVSLWCGVPQLEFLLPCYVEPAIPWERVPQLGRFLIGFLKISATLLIVANFSAL